MKAESEDNHDHRIVSCCREQKETAVVVVTRRRRRLWICLFVVCGIVGLDVLITGIHRRRGSSKQGIKNNEDHKLAAGNSSTKEGLRRKSTPRSRASAAGTASQLFTSSTNIITLSKGDHVPPPQALTAASSPAGAANITAVSWKEAENVANATTELDLLLQSRAVNGSIVLLVVNGMYTEMLQNCLCNLDALGVDSYIAAITHYPTYKRFHDSGYAVFYYNPASSKNSSTHLPDKHFDQAKIDRLEADCAYESVCFATITMIKPQIVLMILKKGYNVLFTDADVLWLTDVRPDLLLNFLPADIWIQTEIQPPEAAPNQYLNSGLYSVRSSPSTQAALLEIMQRKSKVNHEQQSFNRVLCGRKGEGAPEKKTNSTCLYHTVRTHILDFRTFPNGKLFRFLRQRHPTIQQLPPQVKVVHNNYIKHLDAKVERWKSFGFWFAGAGNQAQCLEAARAKLLHRDFSSPDVKAIEATWKEAFG